MSSKLNEARPADNSRFENYTSRTPQQLYVMDFAESKEISKLRKVNLGTQGLKGKNENYNKIISYITEVLRSRLGVNTGRRYWEILIGQKVNEITEIIELRKLSNNKTEGVFFSRLENEKINTGDDAVKIFRQNKEINNKIIRIVGGVRGGEKENYNISLKNYSRSFIEKIEKIKLKIENKLYQIGGNSNGSGKSKSRNNILKRINCDVLVFTDKINFHDETIVDVTSACDLRVRGGALADFGISPKMNSGNGIDFGRDLDGTCNVILQLLEDELGGGFVEEYVRAKETVENMVERWPTVILDAFPGNKLLQRVLVAEAVERGAALVSVQHGGWYGEIGYYGQEWIEKQISDRFATWGYKNEEIDIELPAAKLMNDRRTQTSGESLLWLSRSVDHWGDYLYPATFFDVIGGVSGPHEGRDRFERATELYDLLRQAIRSNILLRFDYKHLPDEKGYMRQLKRRIDMRLDEATIDRGGAGLEGRIREARLILVDHVPSTVFAECIHSGVPTILFDKIEDKWLTDKARESYQALEDAGVLFQDPEAAARKVDEIYADPVDWWTSSEVENAINEYKNEFAYVGGKPAEEWAAFLEELHARHTS